MKENLVIKKKVVARLGYSTTKKFILERVYSIEKKDNDGPTYSNTVHGNSLSTITNLSTYF